MSHPTWVCGLKLFVRGNAVISEKSHPTWVCGLKLKSGPATVVKTRSHPTWVCGLKRSERDKCGVQTGHTLRGCVD